MKKQFLHLLTISVLALFVCITFGAASANAYGLTQQNLSKNSITVSWEPESRATTYIVYAGADYSSLAEYARLPVSETSVTIQNVPAGSERCISVKYEYLTYSGSTGSMSVGQGTYKTLPAKVSNVHQVQWWYYIEDFSVSWDRQAAADGYNYKVVNSKGKKIASGSTTSNTIFISEKVSNSMVYTVQVRAYIDFNGKKHYGGWSGKCYCFTQPQLKQATVSGNKLTVKWNKVNGATGYDVYVSLKEKTGYRKVKSTGKNVFSATITKLGGKAISSKKRYYVYVISKKKVGKRTFTCGKQYYWQARS